MPRTCTIRAHPERDALEAAMVAGETLRDIARRFRVGKDTARHKADNLPERLAKAHEVEEVDDADALLSRLRGLNRETAAILKEAREEGSKDNELALKAIACVEEQIELEGRLLDVLNDRPQVNILVSPEWLTVRGAVFDALGGSIGLIGAARSGLVVAADPDDPERRILAPNKNNLSKPAPSLAFGMETAKNGAARVVWSGRSDLSAAQILRPPTDEGDESARSKAKDFLLYELRDSPMAA